jgi:hypothetical protein
MTIQEKAANEATRLVDKHWIELSDLSVMDKVLDHIAVNQAIITVDNMLALLDYYNEEMESTQQYEYWGLVRSVLVKM